MALYSNDIAPVDLDKNKIYRSPELITIGEGDELADRFGVEVLRGGIQENLSGVSCYGYFIRPSGDTVTLTGTVNGNRAYVDLEAACYVYNGPFSLAIKLVGSGVTGTLRIVDGIVRRTTTDTIVDPGSVVPDLATLLAQIAACEQATEDAQDAAANYQYLANDVNALTPTDGADTTNYGIHRWVEDGEIRLSGTATESRRVMLWNGYNATYTTANDRVRRILRAGRYKFNVSYVGDVVKTSVKATYSTFANEFTINDGDVVTLTEDAMIALYIVNGENYGVDDDHYTAVTVTAVLLTARDEIAREQYNPYTTHYIKRPGELSPDGFAHQAFPDLLYSDGNTYIISRQAPSHYVTTSDPDEYGGMSIDKVTPDGKLSHVRFIQSSEEPYASAGVQYQMGTGCASPTPDGGAVIMSGWTSDNASHHSNYLAIMSRTLQTTAAVLGNPFTHVFNENDGPLTILPEGKPLFTPDGYIILSAYRENHLFMVRSNQVYGSVPFASLTFTETELDTTALARAAGAIDPDDPDAVFYCNEGMLGYCNDGNGGKRLYMLARNNTPRPDHPTIRNTPAALFYNDNVEGTGSWHLLKAYVLDEDGYDTILHNPRLLPYNRESNILWFTAANYRSASLRNAVLGFIDLANEDHSMYIGKVATGLNYGGYSGFMRFSGEEFDVAYYREGTVTEGATPEQAMQSALMYKRVSARQIVPKINTYI